MFHVRHKRLLSYIPVPDSIYTVLLVTEIGFVGFRHVCTSFGQYWSIEKNEIRT